MNVKNVMASVALAVLMMCTLNLRAQVAPQEAFQQKLNLAGLFFMEPVEGKYKPLRKPADLYQQYDYAIRSRREKMEIRYLVEPWRENNPLSGVPHVRATQLVMHLATNQGEGLIIGQNIGQETLLDDFNADWGKVFYFEPKDAFSLNRECKLLVLHKGGLGTAYVFFLYDKITVELDKRFLALQFKNAGEEH
jgi:hypothetical protein